MAAQEAAAVPWVPEDTFGARLALVRQRMHWNYEQAGTKCGISAENWRQWEKGERRPQRMDDVCQKIAGASGCHYVWLIAGGPNDLTRIGSSLTPIETYGQLELAVDVGDPVLCLV